MQRTVIDERYTLVGPLGGGGMAEVYLAHDEVLDREVAIKILRGQYADDEEFVERFRREAMSAAGLSHPNIVSIYDRGRSEDGAYYIAMEYVPRGTLKDRILRDGALDPGVAAGVALQITDALFAAHEHGVIHRDIKPQNVLVTRTGDVKVTDFGIARAASSTVTATSVVLGTAGYMSPEQAMGEPVGPRSDLYSLGVVLYEMLTGALPYSAENPVALSMMHVNEPPRSPREANPDVPEPLDALTRKLLAKNPEDRYASAAALADDLERVRSGLPPAAVEAAKTTEEMAAPLPPLPAAPEEGMKRIAVRPLVAALAPGRGRRRRTFLAVLLFGLILLAGLALALSNFLPQLGGSAEEQPETPVSEEPSTTVVPELAGVVYRTEAQGVLEEAGLVLGTVNEASSNTIPVGMVGIQDPAAGEEVDLGTPVNIVVSTGPPQPPAVQAPAPAPPVYEEPEKPEKEKKEKPKGKGKGKGKQERKGRDGGDEDEDEEGED